MNLGLGLRLFLHLRRQAGFPCRRIWELRSSPFIRCNGRMRKFCGCAVEQFSDDEYECDFENQKPSSSVANIDEWRWKLSLLLRNSTEKEIISKDRKDRRDYEQISSIAKKMGLYSELYGKVVVASKVPLPNYRPDLDEKRPQKEVVIPLSLQRRAEGLLLEHLDRLQLSIGKNCDHIGDPMDSEASIIDDKEGTMLDHSVMEKILQRKSLRMRNLQRAWQESPEGVKMLNFRRSLPAYKMKEQLLSAIAICKESGFSLEPRSLYTW